MFLSTTSYLFTTEYLQLLARILGALVVLPAVWEAWQISRLLQNISVGKLVKKITLGLAILVLSRIIASYADNFFGFSNFPFTGYLVNALFWLWVAWHLYRQRVAIASELMGIEGRRRVSQYIDEIIKEIEQVRLQHRLSRRNN